MGRTVGEAVCLPLASPWSWLAGVLDAKGRFVLRCKQRGDVVYGEARVIVPGPSQTLAAALVRVAGGMTSKRAWYLPAEQQTSVLAKVMPYMVAQKDAASLVYQWRIMDETREGKPVDGATSALRRQLVKEMKT